MTSQGEGENDNRSIGEISKTLCLRMALQPKTKSARKRRLMKLWEAGIIKSGEVQTLIRRYGLKHS